MVNMVVLCGENLNKTGRGNDFKFTYKPNELLVRTENKYQQQVQESIRQNTVYEGIKGPTYLSNWLPLPTSTIIDYMHASLLGLTKQIFNIWLSTENRKEEFYLKLKLHEIDEILLQTKYPIEFSRQQRSISENFKFFKASQYRNLLFYASLPILKMFLPATHYKHFVQFIIFMRLLCDKDCQNHDTVLAFKIIVEFIKEFEQLYGQKNMTFNLHSHLHLPQQVQRLRFFKILS